MINKLIKIFLCFAISLSFAQDNSTSKEVSGTSFNIQIEGMHCAAGCAKGLENALNNVDGIQAKIDFIDSNTPGTASITYNPNLFTDNEIINMINGVQDGKYKASLINDSPPQCSKGKQCCQKTGQLNPECDNKEQGCCSGSKKKCKKKKKKKKKK